MSHIIRLFNIPYRIYLESSWLSNNHPREGAKFVLLVRKKVTYSLLLFFYSLKALFRELAIMIYKGARLLALLDLRTLRIRRVALRALELLNVFLGIYLLGVGSKLCNNLNLNSTIKFYILFKFSSKLHPQNILKNPLYGEKSKKEFVLISENGHYTYIV